MRPTRMTVLLTAGLVTLLGIPAVAAAETPTDLYVNNGQGSGCRDSGAGTQDVPFCSISAAAKVVKPGQTVRIVSGADIDEAVTIDRSGDPGKPITFTTDARDGSRGWADLHQPLTISGASHVVLRGVDATKGVTVSRSDDVVLERISGSNSGGLAVGEGSTDVRAIRSGLARVRIDGGSQRTVLSRNLIGFGENAASTLTVVDAPGTVITNNSISGECGPIVSVGGGSTGSALFNNVLNSIIVSGCRAPKEPMGGIAVAQAAAAGTRTDYNLITGNPGLTMVPYNWSGTGYRTLAEFQAASGQGAHDILTPSRDSVGLIEGSPTIDSADATAPGVLLTDRYENPAVDDPRVPNTGKDGGHLDRGADEFSDIMSAVEPMELDETWAPVGTKVTVKAATNSRWPTALVYTVDFGDGTAPVVTRQGDADHITAAHVYTSPCDCAVKVTAVNGIGTKVSASRSTKVAPAGPLTAAFTATAVLPRWDDPKGGTPLTFAVDPSATAAPWQVSGVDVDFGDGASQHVDSLQAVRHTYPAFGDYKVSVTVADVKGTKSTSSRSVKVDYAPSGYVATEPFRLLDTRTTGAPLQGGEPLAVQLPTGTAVPGHELSAGMTAAVLNVTVTDSTEDAHLTVWPAGQTPPASSNVNVAAGGTSSNTVTVPVGLAGKVLAQLNSGRASVIVDFLGYYQPNIGQRFTPLPPTRLLDTRTTGAPLAESVFFTVKVAGLAGIPADATAVALNLTSTGATSNSHVVVYPDPAHQAATSNLNPEPGKDKSNQVIVPVGPQGTVALNINTGSTHVILDAVGYYGKDGKTLFTPTVPRRLADTRSTGKVAPGTATTVSGLPADAVGAVLNVTATDSTAPTFLTAYGYGATRPEASSLNTRPGATVPNHVTTPVGDGGRVSIWNSYGGSTHVITDLLGYFTKG
ncbi:PKD domain-containing protein [Streptomyces sp. NBC_00868]|uniref:PKD domain-containing protein n=1 Tax=Streptomyces sp. NBC_00868 TaxID=2903683 RepID=UPI003866BC25|nr:PKD domain-containing protein [Streptomyces sp. NBC_00868]